MIGKVKVFNTMTRKVEDFEPVHAGKVGFYSCGPTVYSEPHIGNTRAALFADLLKKMLVLAGYDVKHVMNITDVGHLVGDSDDGEDKIEKEASAKGITAKDIAEKYTKIFFDYTSVLNINIPDVVAKVTDHIPEQIDFIKVLEEKGFTYQTSDGIYFDTSKLNDYGKLAKLDIEGLEAGSRVDVGEKKNLTDFALWKFSPSDGAKRQQEWNSPWGVGFPGWHLECSALSLKYLGFPFDIHSGGSDAIPVHHTNEIAQNEAYCGCNSVKYWMHVGMLIMPGGAKMSKSLGHKQTVKTELLDKGIDPLAYRYLCLTAHYRSQMIFSEEALRDSATALKRLQAKALKIKEEAKDSTTVGEISEGVQGFCKRISDALFDDLQTPNALVAFREALDSDISNVEKLYIIERFDSVFCLDLLKEKAELEIPQEVQDLLEKRQIARANKDFKASDELRDKIAALGFVVKDGKDGQTVEKI